MKNGDIVYFKRAKRSTKRSAPEGSFKGYGFGVLLGHCPPTMPDAPRPLVMQALSSIGLLTFDDIVEFLGKEAGDTCVIKCEQKYWGGRPREPDQAAGPKENPAGLPGGGPLPLKTESEGQSNNDAQ